MKEILAGSDAPGVDDVAELRRLLDVLLDNSDVVTSSNDRIQDIVSSLKNFVRLDEADFKTTNLHEGIDSALTLLQHDLGSGIRVKKQYDKIPPVAAHPGELNQAFMTLLRNAIEAIEKEGEIIIKTAALDQQVTIEISDSGRGIPAEEIDSLFEFGFANKGSRIGMRTGLFNVYNTIRKHSGDIRVESRVGRGTTFAIRLPVDAGSQG